VTVRSLVPAARIERAIIVVRGHRVILDADLAALYDVSTKRFNEQVKRNADRFPRDFMFQLSRKELAILRSQFATSSLESHGGRRYLPNVFTEHAALMAASVLNSPKAVEMSVLVIRAFVRLRNFLATHRQIAATLNELEQRFASHDRKFVVLFEAIRELMAPPVKPSKRIGFRAEAS
jgi:hypothetical protein